MRCVDGYYEKGCFYTITYALSHKIKQIEKNPNVAICGEWFTATGIGENIGYVCAEKNKEIADKMRHAFASWYDNGHTDESDPNTIILKIKLIRGLLQTPEGVFDIKFDEIDW